MFFGEYVNSVNGYHLVSTAFDKVVIDRHSESVPAIGIPHNVHSRFRYFRLRLRYRHPRKKRHQYRRFYDVGSFH
jgi:hypothetical protein